MLLGESFVYWWWHDQARDLKRHDQVSILCEAPALVLDQIHAIPKFRHNRHELRVLLDVPPPGLILQRELALEEGKVEESNRD